MSKTQQSVALEMIEIQPDHGGLSKTALMLHQKQAEDAEKMEQRMCEIEKKVDTLGKKVDGLDQKVDELKELVIQRASFTASLKEILSNRVFLYLLIILIASIFGVSTAEVGTFLFK